jgi:tripartite-type tricarboxylate transporter receptor subunit TctC
MLALIAFALGSGLAKASEPPFYMGKTLTIVEGRSPGSSSDIRSKTVIKYMIKHLPGNPSVVYQYMPAAGGMAAAIHVANVAKKDGLTLGSTGSGLYHNAIFGGEGIARFKLEDFAFLGSPEAGGPYTIVIRPQLGLDTVEKLKAYKGLRFAQRSVGHRMYLLDRIFSYVLELKEPKWVLGYNQQEMRTAIERLEADAMSNSLPSFVGGDADWLKEGYAAPVVMKNAKGQGAEAVPGFPRGRPNLDQYADTELKRAVLKLHDASSPGGTPHFVHKDIPAEALKALREAFDKAWRDPEFVKEYERMTKDKPEPTTGVEIEHALRQRPTDPKVIEFYKQLIGAGPLPTNK